MDNNEIKGLVDIIAPHAPATHPDAIPLWLIVAAGVVLLLAIVAIAAWRRRSAPRRRSLNNLNLIRRRIDMNCTDVSALSAQAGGYLLAAEICRQFGMRRLLENRMPPGFSIADQESWRHFVATLDGLRYQSGDEGKNRRAALQLLDQAQRWIERALP